MVNSRARYDRSRKRFNQLVSNQLHMSDEAASLFYYLNRTGYNGLCRFNARGLFNVPFGTYRTINYKTNFSEYTKEYARFCKPKAFPFVSFFIVFITRTTAAGVESLVRD